MWLTNNLQFSTGVRTCACERRDAYELINNRVTKCHVNISVCQMMLCQV